MKYTSGVYGGGGSNGDWQAGRIVALIDNGFKPDLLTGTSVGALNALAHACGMYHILEPLWVNLYESQVMEKSYLSRAIMQEALSHIGLARERKSLYNSEPLRRLLDEKFLGKKCQIDYYCSVVVIGNNSPNRYMKHYIPKDKEINGTDLDMVWASTAIPVVFEEVNVNGMKLFDGGVLQSTPIRHTIRHYPTTDIVGVVCQPLGTLDTELGKGLVGRAGWTINAMLREQFENEWNNIHNWNSAISQWKEKVPHEDLIIDGLPVKYINTDLHAPDRILGNPLNFNASKTSFNFYDGYNSFK